METLRERMQAANLTPSRAALGAMRFAEGLNRSVTLSHPMRAIDPGAAAAFSAQVLRRFATLADPRPLAADIAQRYTADEAAAPSTTLPLRLPHRSDLPSGTARWAVPYAASDSATVHPDTGALSRTFDSPARPVSAAAPLPSLLDELLAHGWGGPPPAVPAPPETDARTSSRAPAITPHPAETGARSATVRAGEHQFTPTALESAAQSRALPAARVIARQSAATHSPSGSTPDDMRVSRAPHATLLLRASRPDPVSRMGIAPQDAPFLLPAWSSGGEPLTTLTLRRMPSVERSAESGAPPSAPLATPSQLHDAAVPSLSHPSLDAAIGSGAAPLATMPAADAASRESSPPDTQEAGSHDAALAQTPDTHPDAGTQIPSLETNLSRATAPVQQPAQSVNTPSSSGAPDIQRSSQSGSPPGLRPSPLHLPMLIARRYHLAWREGEVQQMPLLRSPILSQAPARPVPTTAYRKPGLDASATTTLPAMRSASAPLIAPTLPSLGRTTQPDTPAMLAGGDSPDRRDPSVALPPGFAPAPLPLARAASPGMSSEATIGRASPARLVERSAPRDAVVSRLADGTAGVRDAAVPLVGVQRTVASWQPFAAHAAYALPLSTAGSVPGPEASERFDEERRIFQESTRPTEQHPGGPAETFPYRSPPTNAFRRSGADQQSRHAELTVARRAGYPAEAAPLAPALDMIAPRRSTTPAAIERIYRAVDDTPAPSQAPASAEAQSEAAPAQPQDIEKIAQQVYDHLRRRLLIDQERRGRTF